MALNALQQIKKSVSAGLQTAFNATPVGMAVSAVQKASPQLKNLDQQFQSFVQERTPQVQPVIDKVTTNLRRAPVTVVAPAISNAIKMSPLPKVDLKPILDDINRKANQTVQIQNQLKQKGVPMAPLSPVPVRALLTDFEPQLRKVGDFIDSKWKGIGPSPVDVAKFAVNMTTGGAYSPDEKEYFRKIQTGEPLTNEDVAAAKRLAEQSMFNIGFAVAGVKAKRPIQMQGLSKLDLDAARSVLKKYGFIDKDFSNVSSLKTKFRNTTKVLHPDVGGNPEEFKTFIDAYNKMTSAKVDAGWGVNTALDWIKDLWKKTKAEAKQTKTLELPTSKDLTREAKKFSTLTDWVEDRVNKLAGDSLQTKNLPEATALKGEIAKLEAERLDILARNQGFGGIEDLFNKAKGIIPKATQEIPSQIQGIIDNAVSSGLSKEQFLEQYNAGLNAQNLSIRDTAQMIDAYLKREMKLSPEEFYDKQVSQNIPINQVNPELQEMIKRKENLMKLAQEAQTPEDLLSIQETIKKIDESISNQAIAEVKQTDMPQIKLQTDVLPTTQELLQSAVPEKPVSQIGRNIEKIEKSLEGNKKAQKFLQALTKKQLSEVERFNQLARYISKNNIVVDLTEGVQATGKELETFSKPVEEWKKKDFDIASQKLEAPVEVLQSSTPDQVRVLMQASGIEPVFKEPATEPLVSAPEAVETPQAVEQPKQEVVLENQEPISPESLVENPQLDGMPVQGEINVTPKKQQVTPFDQAVAEMDAVSPPTPVDQSPATTLPFQSQGIPVKDQIVRFDGGTQQAQSYPSFKSKDGKMKIKIDGKLETFDEYTSIDGAKKTRLKNPNGDTYSTEGWISDGSWNIQDKGQGQLAWLKKLIAEEKNAGKRQDLARSRYQLEQQIKNQGVMASISPQQSKVTQSSTPDQVRVLMQASGIEPVFKEPAIEPLVSAPEAVETPQARNFPQSGSRKIDDVKIKYPDPIQNPLYDEMRQAQDVLMKKINELGKKGYKSDAEIPKKELTELNRLKAEWNQKAKIWKDTYSKSPVSQPLRKVKPGSYTNVPEIDNPLLKKAIEDNKRISSQPYDPKLDSEMQGEIFDTRNPRNFEAEMDAVSPPTPVDQSPATTQAQVGSSFENDLTPERSKEFDELVEKAEMFKKKKEKITLKGVLLDLRKNFLNQHAYFQDYAARSAAEIGRSLQPSEDPAVQTTLYMTGTHAYVELFRDQVGEVIEQAKKSGIYELFSRYRVAGAFIHRLDLRQRKVLELLQGDEIDKKEAERILDKIAKNEINPRKFSRKESERILEKTKKEAKEKFEIIDTLSKKIASIKTLVLKQMVIDGVISSETFSYLESMPNAEFYLPVEILDYATDVYKGTGGNNFNVEYQTYLRNLEGTTQDIANPLGTFIDKLGELARARKNRVFQSFYNTEKAKVDKWNAEHPPEEHISMPIAKNTVRPVARVETADGVKQVFRPPNNIKPQPLKEGEEIISGMIDGERVYLSIDAKVAEAYNKTGQKAEDLLFDMLRVSKRFASRAFTVWNLAFTAPNIVRDTTRSALYSRYSPLVDPLSSPMFIADIGRSLAAIATRETSPIMRLYALAGAEGSSTQKILNEDFQSQVKYYPEKTKKKMLQKIQVFGKEGLVARINEGAEDMNKVTFFIRGLRAHGLYDQATKLQTFEQAVDFANKNREVLDYIAMDNTRVVGTPNSRVIGAKMSGFNRVMMFLNVNIQGQANDLSSLFPKGKNTTMPKEVRGTKYDASKEWYRRWLFITSYVMVFTALKMLSNEKSDTIYKEVSDRTEQDNAIIPLGIYKTDPLTGEKQEYYIKIPKDRSIAGAITNLSEAITDYIFNIQEVNLFDSAVESGLSVVPLGIQFRKDAPIWKSLFSGLFSKVVPFVQIPVGLAANYDFYRMKELETEYQRGLPTTARYNSYTTEFAKDMSRLSNGMLSPIQIDYIVRNLLGDVGTGITQLSDIASGKAPAKLTPERTFGLSRFLAVSDNAEQREFVKGVKSKVEELGRWHSLLNQYKKSGNIAAYEDLIEKNPDVLKYNALNNLVRKSREMEDSIRAINNSTEYTPQQKEEKVREARGVVDEIFNTINGLLSDQIKKQQAEQQSKNTVGAAEQTKTGKESLPIRPMGQTGTTRVADIKPFTPVDTKGKNTVEAIDTEGFKPGSAFKLDVPSPDEILEKTDTGKTPVRIPTFEEPTDYQDFELQFKTYTKTLSKVESLINSIESDDSIDNKVKAYYIEQYQNMLKDVNLKRGQLGLMNPEFFSEYILSPDGAKWFKSAQTKARKEAGIKLKRGRKSTGTKVIKAAGKVPKLPVIKATPSKKYKTAGKIKIKAPPKIRVSTSVAAPPSLKLTPIKLPKAINKIIKL